LGQCTGAAEMEMIAALLKMESLQEVCQRIFPFEEYED
jgi:hypothetical protein